MSVKLKLKKGDTVKVTSGDLRKKDKNTGKILSVDTTKLTAIVEGLNLVKRHTKPNSTHPQGGIVEKEAPIHISNLALLEGDKGVRIGRKLDEKTNKLVRYSKKSQEVIK